jgi:transposase
VSNVDVSRPNDNPLPRPERCRRRAKADRGLPPDAELARLATEYSRCQRQLWPELVKAGLLPEPTEAVIAPMVEDFKARHRGGRIDPAALRPLLKHAAKLAGNYDRFSCDNSSPLSIIDQMVKSLNKARQEGRFVPWQYVFADYSVTGTDRSRQGYTSYKAALQGDGQLIETTYIDDFTRASRDEIEWWKLAHLSRKLGKRMVGASDGFDLSAVDWEVKIAVYGLISRLFLKGLRQKVKRGLGGAARRGTCVGKPALGFTRCPVIDEAGRPVLDPHRLPVYRPCIDPVTRGHRELLYELFLDRLWTPYRIARHFNTLKVDGWGGWTEGGVKKLLASPTAIGVFIWNRKRREYDIELGKWVVAVNPRSEWEVYHDKDLAIVPVPRWAAAKKRLAAVRAASPLTGRKRSRNQISASTLFSGTLFCASCGAELKLTRSAGKYKVMGCLNGPTGKHGCTLATSKSTRIIEAALLTFLTDRLLTESAVLSLVEKANGYLAAEAARPRADTSGLRATIRKKETEIARLFDRLGRTEDEALVQAYERRIAASQKEVNSARAELRKLEVRDAPPPAPLDAARVAALLADARGLLNGEVAAAAEAIRELTGRITVRQEAGTGRKRGAKWIATFTPDFVGWLARWAKEKSCPDSVTLEYLCTRIWITPEPVEVVVGFVTRHEKIAAEAARLRTGGASVRAIAVALGESDVTVRQAQEFARTGEKQRAKPHGRRTGTQSGPPRYVATAGEVVRLRDEEHWSFKRIAAHLGMNQSTAVRAYDHARPEAARAAAAEGAPPRRGRYCHLPAATFEAIRSMLREGRPATEIAAEVGCGVNTVRRAKQALTD